MGEMSKGSMRRGECVCVKTEGEQRKGENGEHTVEPVKGRRGEYYSAGEVCVYLNRFESVSCFHALFSSV